MSARYEDDRPSHSRNFLSGSISSVKGPESECLLVSELPVVITAGRRQSCTAPPSPSYERKKRGHGHGYINHLQHLIHWKELWGIEYLHKPHESLHRSESMVSLACYRTLSAFVNEDNAAGLQAYLGANKNVLVDDKDENGGTVLMAACEAGAAAVARALLAAGADPGAADADGWTPLAICARAPHLALARDLLDAGAPVDPRDMGGWTPLMWASYKGHEDMVALLLERGADFNAHGNYNISSLVWAAGRKHSGIVKRLLAAGARPNSCDKYATTALTWAARAGDAVSCAALLQAGADPNTAGMFCWTPLLQATQGNHYEIVQMLLEHKPNVNALDKDGYTALAIACKEGFYDIAVSLINAGAYINVQDHSKDTCLIHAVKGGHKNIVEALLKKHVDVDLPGKEKKTPVYTAVEKGHTHILKLLLSANPDLELTTVTGDTPLLRAVRSRNAEIVQMLLERKVRLGVADKRGDTALHIAMRARSKQIVEILLRNPKHSQLLYKPNKSNETPYNMDMSYPKTILGQIFGARKLNTNEDNENMLGYELYSAALADMLSEPCLSVPITVGLYARWGSGKSFLLTKLKEEMKNFARQWRESGWAWSWAVCWAAWHCALCAGAAALALLPPLPAALAALALFVVLYLALYLLWYLGNRYEWWWAESVTSALGRQFGSLLLVLQVVFCHPPGPQSSRVQPAMPIRFHFTEGAKGSSQEGEASMAQMLGSLTEALESQYGRVCTRLARVFHPKPVASTAGWRWRRACCLPYIIVFEGFFLIAIVGIGALVLLLTEDGIGQRREVEAGVAYGAAALAGVMALANLYTVGRVLGALAVGPRARLARALRHDAPTLALRPEVDALTDIVGCLDAFTGQQTRLVLVVDALDSCEQDRVLALLNAAHALCSQPRSPFILLLAIDPHMISKAVEVNSRRAFSESNIGGWDYLRNMVQLPFYLQNSALRRVKIAQQTAFKRCQNADDFGSTMQRSVSARRLSSTSELMSSQERIKPAKEGGGSTRSRRLRPSESAASSVASGLHRLGAPGPAVVGAGAADLSRVLLTDDYFSDVNPRSMRRLMNVLYITGRLLKAFQIEFNWYQLASWVNLTEQWPFRTSWIIYHHETYEDHIDDSTSIKHIYDKIKPSIPVLRDAEPMMELDRDERKLEVFLNFHRTTLLAADIKIFLPFTINLDPYLKKLIKEEQQQCGVDEEIAGPAGALPPPARPPHPKLFNRKLKQLTLPSGSGGGGGASLQPGGWGAWNMSTGYSPPAPAPAPALAPAAPLQPQPLPQPPLAHNVCAAIRTAFPQLGDVSSVRLSSLSVEGVCALVRAALREGGAAASAALARHRVCGMVLVHCDLADLKQVLELPFGDWELFKVLVLSLKDLEATMPIASAPIVTVIPEKTEPDREQTKPRPTLETQRSRPSNVEKQVTLEEQMICGALQTLNEEALEDVLASDPAPSPPPDEEGSLVLRGGLGVWDGSPLSVRREPCLVRAGSVRQRAPPAVTFSVENENDSDEGQITFTAHPPNGSRPSSLMLTTDELILQPMASRSQSVEDSAFSDSLLQDSKQRTYKKNDKLKKVSSADRLSKLKEKILSRGSTSREKSPAKKEERAPLVSSSLAPTSTSPQPSSPIAMRHYLSSSSSSPDELHTNTSSHTSSRKSAGTDCIISSIDNDNTVNTDFSPDSESSKVHSPSFELQFDVLPPDKCGTSHHKSTEKKVKFSKNDSSNSISNMLEPYNMRLLAHGTSESSLKVSLWRQDALDGEPSWDSSDSIL